MRLSLIVVALGCALASCATAHPEVADQHAGERFAQRRCSGCHMIGLDETEATSGPRFRDLAERFSPEELRRRFAVVSAHGAGEMPPIEFSQDDARNLAAYMATLSGPRAAERPPGER